MTTRTLATAIVLAAGTATSSAQVIYSESFDNTGASGTAAPPANLLAQGWEFSIQQIGEGDAWWSQGPAGFPANFPPHEGSGYLAGLTGRGAPFSGARIAMWAVLPDIPLSGGEEITIWLNGEIPELFELRFSPTGDTDTGTTPEDLGSFTTLLARDQFVLGPWHEIVATVPADGRIALRYYENGLSLGAFVMAFDDLTINATRTQAPLPVEGETVRWTTDLSPITIDQQWTILPGGTVIIDPGVEIIFEGSEGQLLVEGELIAEGTASSPITLRGSSGATSAGIRAAHFRTSDPGPIVPARVTLDHVDSDTSVSVGAGSGVTIRNSRFTNGLASSGITTLAGTLAIYDSTFEDCLVDTNETYVFLDGVTFDNSQIDYHRRHLSTTMHIANCTFRNLTADAPILVTDGNDIFLGEGNTFENNLYPVRLRGGGIFPGSTLPATGSTNNHVHVEEFGGTGKRSFAAIDLPYNIGDFGGVVDVEPGAHFKVRANGIINPEYGRWLGTPDAPILLERANPDQPWDRIASANHTGAKLEGLHIRGARAGIQNADGRIYALDCLVEDCEFGAVAASLFGLVSVERTKFLNNGTAIYTTDGRPGTGGFGAGVMLAGFPNNPNWIEGSPVGAGMGHPNTTHDARHIWWGDPSGPTHPENPGGSGPIADPAVDIFPFLTAPYDFDDHPPVVRFQTMSPFLWEGHKLILHWDARDEGEIVAQRLEYRNHQGSASPLTFVAELDPDARSIEVVVPLLVLSSDLTNAAWRITAVDDQGQEGWSEYDFSHYLPGDETLEFSPDLTQGFTVGQRFDLSWTPDLPGNLHVLVDDIRGPKIDIDLGGVIGQIGQIQNDIPAVSSDTVRYGLLRVLSSHDRRYWMSDYFTVRPEPIAGDAPPEITLTSPVEGGDYRGGSVVPVRWSASDDNGLRAFDIQATYDGGFSWHFITNPLPGDARAYDWDLPASTGIIDVQLRVIARDSRSQATSDGTGRTFDIIPGDSCRADLDGDGQLTIFDFLAFQNAFDAGDPIADFDADGSLTIFDFLAFQNEFDLGCE